MNTYVYREVKLDLTPEIKVLHRMFVRCHTKNRMRSIKQHINYFNFRSKVQLDPAVEKNSKKPSRDHCESLYKTE